MLSGEARGTSNEPSLRLDEWMALIFSAWSFRAMAHRAHPMRSWFSRGLAPLIEINAGD
jgi:hypothetical protein